MSEQTSGFPMIEMLILAMCVPSLFHLNRFIYKKSWFVKFIPVSLILFAIGILIKDKIEFDLYKILILVPVQVYLIKITQLAFTYFDQDYIVNIRGCDFGERDRDLYGMPTMDTLFSVGIIIVMLALFFII